MTQDIQTVNHKSDAVTIFKSNIARQEREFRAALPAHIPVERFIRVLTTAVVNNPDLLAADRRSLFESAMKAAHDGLYADGREGALVIFNTKIKVKGNDGKDKDIWIKKVQWMPMVAGILKKVRNSGELQSISAHVVYSNDDFSYALGDDERIEHRPALDNRGAPRLLYAIARLKDGGIYREIMTVDDVEKVRAISRAKDSGPWAIWWDEMAKKTVLRRLSKRLPMSSDLDDLTRRDDYDYEGESGDVGSPRHLSARIVAETSADRLTADLDAIAAGGNGDGNSNPGSRAAPGGPDYMPDPPHDPETGEIIDAGHGSVAEGNNGTRNGAEDGEPATDTPASDQMSGDEAARQLAAKLEERALANLLADARAKIKDGPSTFTKWEKRLSAPEFERFKPHRDAILAEAVSESAK